MASTSGLTPLHRALARAAKDLSRAGARFAITGGLAVAARAAPRFTQDIDLAVAVKTDADAEALIHGLARIGYRVQMVLEQEATGRLATVRLSSPTEPPIAVDLLFASSGIEPEIVAGAQDLAVVRGLKLPVASVGHLLAQKVLALELPQRARDLEDIRSLCGVARIEDLREARDALHVIQSRGYARGKDLAAEAGRLLGSERTEG